MPTTSADLYPLARRLHALMGPPDDVGGAYAT